MAHLLRITEVRDTLESHGADDGHQGQQARGQENHPGVPGQQQDVPVVSKVFRICGEIILTIYSNLSLPTLICMKTKVL